MSGAQAPVWEPRHPPRPDGTIVVTCHGSPYHICEPDPMRAPELPTLAAALAAAEGLDLPPEPGPPAPPLSRREVPKLVVVDRLEAAGLGEAAEAALAADSATRRRWQACTSLYADDPDAHAFLTAIGANPAEILAP